MTIQLAIDRSLVDAYNSEYGTSYVALQNAELENATLYIKQGEYISVDTLKVHYTNMEEFKNGSENYILPIAITSINGTGVSASESNSKIFLTFESTYKPNPISENDIHPPLLISGLETLNEQQLNTVQLFVDFIKTQEKNCLND